MDYGERVRKIRYKPGWKFTYKMTDWGPTIDIHATVPHSVTLEPTTFLFTRLIPELPGEDLFKAWVKTVLAEAELHELDEFFRYDGKLVNDPHAPVTAGKELS